MGTNVHTGTCRTASIATWCTVVLATVFTCLRPYAQIQNLNGYFAMDRDFAAAVTTIDEFITRFNNASLHADTLSAQETGSLFDLSMPQIVQSDPDFMNLCADFFSTIAYTHPQLSLDHPSFFATVDARGSLNGKPFKAQLTMQREVMPDNVARWAIRDVDGLHDNAALKLDGLMYVDPVDNEVSFLDMQGMMELNPDRAFGFRASDAKIDQLSAFLTLLKTGQLKITTMQQPVYHCASIPGFYLKIEYFNREGLNQGWLISDIQRKKRNLNDIGHE